MEELNINDIITISKLSLCYSYQYINKNWKFKYIYKWWIYTLHVATLGHGKYYLVAVQQSLANLIPFLVNATVVSYPLCRVWLGKHVGRIAPSNVSTHAQLNQFCLKSTLGITCVISRTRPSSRLFACNIIKLGERAWGWGYIYLVCLKLFECAHGCGKTGLA